MASEDRAGSAFDLPGGPDAVLLLHGLTGSPFEVRPVAEALQQAGARCLGPVMPGHGGDPRALDGLGWREWVEGARLALFRLEGSERLLVVGCSMGALVALVLAHEHPGRVDGLALLAPALELALLPRLAGMVARRLRLVGAPLIGKRSSDVRDPEMRRRNPALQAIPPSALGELVRMQAHVENILPGVAVPALVIAGARDHTVTVAGARRIARRIGSAPARLVVLPHSAHLVGIDVERERVADEVVALLARIPARRRKER
jgi:carboxylesterase